MSNLFSAAQAAGFVETYFEVIAEWVVEFYVIFALIIAPLKKRENFVIKLIAGFLVVLGVAAGDSVLYMAVGDKVWGRALVYAILFCVSVAHFMLLFDLPVLLVIVFADLAYVIQNLIYRLFRLSWIIMSFVGVIPSEGIGSAAYKTVYYIQFLLQTVIFYFVCMRAARKLVSERRLAETVVIVSTIIILALDGVSSMTDIASDALASKYYSHGDAFIFFIIVAANLSAILTNVCVIILLFNSRRKNQLQDKVETLDYLLAQSKKQYEVSKETIEAINLKCHDMRHRVSAMLSDKNVPKDTLADVAETISIYDSSIKTGNKTLDVILTEKALVCGHEKIVFSCIADGTAVNFVDRVDLCCLVGNILDNAVEACKKIPDEKKRIIDFSVKKASGGVALVDAWNYYEGELVKTDGEFGTTKADKTYHGFGLKSIKNVAEKYGGSVNTETDGGIFRISVVLFDSST